MKSSLQSVLVPLTISRKSESPSPSQSGREQSFKAGDVRQVHIAVAVDVENPAVRMLEKGRRASQTARQVPEVIQVQIAVVIEVERRAWRGHE